MTDQSIPVTTETQAPKPIPKLGWGSIFLLVSIVIAGIIIGVAMVQQNQTQPVEGVAPTFNFTTFDGVDYALEDLRGKIVVINFWASWCAPCRLEAPEFQAAWEEYEGRDDVVFLGIAYADNGPRSLEFIEEFGITYLNAPDLGTRISEKYNIEGVPETFIIDKEGNVAEFIYAGVTYDQLTSIINGLLSGSQS